MYIVGNVREGAVAAVSVDDCPDNLRHLMHRHMRTIPENNRVAETVDFFAVHVMQ